MSRRNYRKKEATPEEPASSEAVAVASDLHDADEEERRLRLETARELQKFRQRTLGVTAEKLMKSDAEAASKKQEKAAAAVPKGGITYPGGTEPSSVERQFTQQTNTIDVDKHMVAYVEEQMRLRRGVEQQASDKPVDLVTELYLSSAVARVNPPKEDLPEGGPALSAALLAQIPEVDLGVDSKIKNIEATEMARVDFMVRKIEDEKRRHEVDLLPSNMASNFEKKRGRGESDQATDDQLMERFKKRFTAMERRR